MRTLRPARRRPFAYPVVAAATAVLLGLGGLTACSSDEEPTEAPADVPVPGVAVTVLDAGEGEASPLVWFNDDTEQETTFHATRGLEQSTQGAPEEDDIPYEERTMEIPLTVSTDTDGEDLDATVVAGLPTGDNTDRNDDIATAEGFTMTQSYGQDGRVSSRSFSSPESASGSARASVEQSFTQMTDLPLVFPTEELGEGARWTVSSQVDDSISMRQTVTYTLMKRRAHRSSWTSTSTGPRCASCRARPSSSDSASDSGGRVTVDLRRPVPVSGMIETSTTVTFGEPDSDISVVQSLRTKSVWEPSW